MNHKVVQFVDLHESITSLAGFDFALECDGYSMLEVIVTDTARRYSTGEKKNLILKELARLERDMVHNASVLAKMHGRSIDELKIKFVLTGVVERSGRMVQQLNAALYSDTHDCKVVYEQKPVVLIMEKEKQIWETIGQIVEPTVNTESVRVAPSYKAVTVVPQQSLPVNPL